MKINRRCMGTSAALLLLSAVALQAHVTVRPRESKQAVTETYTMRVPTEGKVATTAVELEIPEGVTIVSTESQNVERKKADDRVTSLVWTVDIQPGQSQEIAFVAKNPSTGTEIAWKVHQRYADGTSSDWVEPAGSRRPASITKLVAQP